MVLLRKKRSTEAARIVQLTILEGNNDTGDMPGKVFYLEPGNNFIGRDPLCEIVLGSRTISRKHANLHVSYDKKSFQVHDLGSANGIVLLPSTVLKNGKKPIASGDEFQVGEIRLKLLVIDQEESLKTMDVNVSDLLKKDG